VTFAFVQTEKATHRVRTLCRTLDVSVSGYYAWAARPESARQRTDRRLRAYIRAAHAQSRGSYGSPRLRMQLHNAGLAVGRRRVIRLMRADGLQGRPQRRFRGTTVVDPRATAAPNQLGRQFRPTAPNAVWAADITALSTAEGWLYLAVLIDLYSRRVVGWATATSLETRLVLAAWQQAVARRGQAPQLHHSDRGSQYTSAAYQAALAAHSTRGSMSRPGNCYDNAVVESFFRTLKQDLGVAAWATRGDARAAVTDYIERFYNPQRLHSTLGYRSPIQFEKQSGIAA